MCRYTEGIITAVTIVLPFFTSLCLAVVPHCWVFSIGSSVRATGHCKTQTADFWVGGGEEVLCYMGYIGIILCGPKGYGFSAVFGHK